MAQLVYGCFNDSDDADRAIRALYALGFKPADVNVVMSSETHKRVVGGQNVADFGAKAADGASVGALAGGALAGIAAGAALLAGVVFAGPLVAAAGAAVVAGAAGGAVIGALTDAGLPADQHQTISKAVAAGDVVVAVNAQDAQLDQVRDILKNSED